MEVSWGVVEVRESRTVFPGGRRVRSPVCQEEGRLSREQRTGLQDMVGGSGRGRVVAREE